MADVKWQFQKQAPVIETDVEMRQEVIEERLVSPQPELPSQQDVQVCYNWIFF